MKGLKIFLVSLGFLVASSFPALAAETITNFSVHADLATSQLLTVTEDITWDFSDTPHHGIFRDIPYRYARNGANYSLHLKVLEVKRDGQTEPFEQKTSDGKLHLKIGRATEQLTGPHTYQLRYETNRALNSFATNTELYWNVTGNDWPVPIERADFSLTMPSTMAPNSVQTICFTGSFGSPEHACTISPNASGVSAQTTRVLNDHEGLTIAYAFPLGIVKPWTSLDLVLLFIWDNAAAVFPLIALAFMLAWWSIRGRDPRVGTIIPEYTPPKDYSPALIAALLAESSPPSKAVTATIIDLACRGYIKIRFEEKPGLLFGHTQTYTFIKQKNDTGVNDYERSIYQGLFKSGDAVKLTDLKEKFYRDITNFNQAIEKEISARQLYDANPGTVRASYVVVGFLVSFGLIFTLGNTPFEIICAIATGLIIAIVGYFMPRRTSLGNKIYTDIKGFAWFLSVTEKDRLDFHNAPERTPQQFMAYLPFAIALGLEKKWAAQFASLTIPPPNWAEGSAISHFNAVSFASSMSDFDSAAHSSAYSAPSSSGSGGSGFSGGGSGGGGGVGGGGSW